MMRAIFRDACCGATWLGLAGGAALAQTAEAPPPPPVPALPSPVSIPVAPAPLGLAAPAGLSLGGGSVASGPRLADETLTTGGLVNPGGLSLGGGAVGGVSGSLPALAARSGVLDLRPGPADVGGGGGGAPAAAGIAGAPSRADAYFDPIDGRSAP